MAADRMELARRIERAEATTHVEIAERLAVLHPELGSRTIRLGGGHLVLNGRHLFVNRVVAGFFDRAPDDGDVDVVREASTSAGVTPAVDLTPATHPDSKAVLADRGFETEDVVHVLFRPLATAAPVAAGSRTVSIRSVRSSGDLVVWQQISADGWGHADAAARAGSDAYAAAWHAVAGDGFVLAHDADDGRPLGCAVVTMRDGVATLGGMATLPAERGRGVQAALVDHRLHLARAHGCDLAATMVRPDGVSERNVMRRGFRHGYAKQIASTPER